MLGTIETRDEAICVGHTAGLSIETLAGMYDLGEQTVRQILVDGGHLTKVPVRTVSALLNAAAQVTGVPVAEIIGKARHRRLVRIRQAVMFLAREEGHTSPVVGKRLGGRDHSTVLHGAEMIAQLIEDGDAVAELVEAIDRAATDRNGHVGEIVRLTGYIAEPREPKVGSGTKRVIVTRVEMRRIHVAQEPEIDPREVWEEFDCGDSTGSILLNGDGESRQEVLFKRNMRHGSARLARALVSARAA